MDGTSRVTGDSQARICERLGVRFPGPTRQRRGKRPGSKPGQVTLRKRNASKSPLLMSKRVKTISKPQFVKRLRDKFRRNLTTGGTVSGI
jgi:hypothetical protein